MRSYGWILMALAAVAHGEEGMWTYDAFPAEQVEKAYGFKPDQAWLDQARLSSVRLANGCSASFVSARGLVMTNHHCVRSCVQQLSSKKADYLATGFVSRTDAEEKRCPATEANQLLEITDVTARIAAATRDVPGDKFNDALKKAMTAIETECAKSPKDRCDVVTLFKGARYALYRYRRIQDVRLAFAPEFNMAAFGGYPDNFNFPRFGFDVAFVRLYEDGKPLQSPQHFGWAKDGAKEGELVFVSGHPGGTDRKLSVADLAFQRDVELPWSIALYAEYRAALRELLRQKPQLERELAAPLRTVENGHKALIGRQEALANPAFFAQRTAEEAKLREKIQLTFKDWQPTDRAFDEVAQALERYRQFRPEYRLLEGGDAFRSELFQLALGLVRAAAERPKANTDRLREFTDAAWPQQESWLTADRPISKDLEEVLLTYSLEKLREKLGADHPTSKALLDKQVPTELARALVRQTKVGDAKFRQALLSGGAKAVEASTDPLIQFARKVDPLARAMRSRYETTVEGALKQGRERIAKSKIQAEGTGTYPDATFTLRLSYGQVKGFPSAAGEVAPFTTFGGLVERSFGKWPFKLSPAWEKSARKVAPATPLDLSTTNDIIGGNSGSPLFNQKREIVGVIFDGNLPSLGGQYFYDPKDNRAVAVDARGIAAGLRTIYGATRIADELGAR